MKYLLPVPNTAEIDRSKALLENIRRRVSEGKVTAYSDLIAESLSALDTFFANLTKPITEGGFLREDDPADPATFNALQANILHDLITVYNASKSLNTALVSGFNFTSSLVSVLESKIRRLASKSQDLQHTTDIFVENIIVVGDDFADGNDVDDDSIPEADRCDVLTGTGVTLRRISATPVTDEAEVKIQSNLPIYEGKFYAKDGEIIPEGGQLHLVEDVAGWKEAGATEDDKSILRAQILDGDADTFWQAERVIDVPAITTTSIAYQELVDMIASKEVDKNDLEVTLTIKLTSPRMVNFIVIDPLHAGDGAWLEVTDISTSIDNTNWSQIDGLLDHNYENILTNEANEELSDHEVAMVLAPNKYQYSGKGVWAFPAREARYLRITLLQRTPVPAPYDVARVTMQGTVVSTHKGHRGTTTATSLTSQTSDLSYIDTLRMTAGSLGSLATSPTRSTTSKDTTGFGTGTATQALQDILDPGRLLHTRSDERSTTFEFSGWSVSNTVMVTKWDKARYMIGLRDLRAFTYEFAEKSESISSEFRSPRPISRIVLLTDELIPTEFNEGGNVQPWIKYFVTLDGTTWHPIAPTTSSVLNNLDGLSIPVTVNINSKIAVEERDPQQSYITVADATKIRLKWQIERPVGLSDRTPVLKAYKLRLFTEGEL